MSRINDNLDAPFPEPPPPLPSASELERLLPLMDAAQKAELLALLEARDRAQAAQPVDTTPAVKELLERAWRDEAATRADPEGWLVAMRAHDERRRYHLARISAARSPPRTPWPLLGRAVGCWAATGAMHLLTQTWALLPSVHGLIPSRLGCSQRSWPYRPRARAYTRLRQI